MTASRQSTTEADAEEWLNRQAGLLETATKGIIADGMSALQTKIVDQISLSLSKEQLQPLKEELDKRAANDRRKIDILTRENENLKEELRQALNDHNQPPASSKLQAEFDALRANHETAKEALTRLNRKFKEAKMSVQLWKNYFEKKHETCCPAAVKHMNSRGASDASVAQSPTISASTLSPSRSLSSALRAGTERGSVGPQPRTLPPPLDVPGGGDTDIAQGSGDKENADPTPRPVLPHKRTVPPDSSCESANAQAGKEAAARLLPTLGTLRKDSRMENSVSSSQVTEGEPFIEAMVGDDHFPTEDRYEQDDQEEQEEQDGRLSIQKRTIETRPSSNQATSGDMDLDPATSQAIHQEERPEPPETARQSRSSENGSNKRRRVLGTLLHSSPPAPSPSRRATIKVVIDSQEVQSQPPRSPSPPQRPDTRDGSDDGESDFEDPAVAVATSRALQSPQISNTGNNSPRLAAPEQLRTSTFGRASPSDRAPGSPHISSATTTPSRRIGVLRPQGSARRRQVSGGQPAQPPAPEPTGPPLRTLPNASLKLSDFRINLASNSGLSYAYTETVRGEARRCLSGCVDPRCCGKEFRALAEVSDESVFERLLGKHSPGSAAGRADRPSHHTVNSADGSDVHLSEIEWLLVGWYFGVDISTQGRRAGVGAGAGPDSASAAVATIAMHVRSLPHPAAVEELVMAAKTSILANAHGKQHRDGFRRRGPTPPGFWDAGFPSTQEEQRRRSEQEDERTRWERGEVELRAAEARRGGGRWVFRDEI